MDTRRQQQQCGCQTKGRAGSGVASAAPASSSWVFRAARQGKQRALARPPLEHRLRLLAGRSWRWCNRPLRSSPSWPAGGKGSCMSQGEEPQAVMRFAHMQLQAPAAAGVVNRQRRQRRKW